MSFFSIWLIWVVLIQLYRAATLALRTRPFSGDGGVCDLRRHAP